MDGASGGAASMLADQAELDKKERERDEEVEGRDLLREDQERLAETTARLKAVALGRNVRRGAEKEETETTAVELLGTTSREAYEIVVHLLEGLEDSEDKREKEELNQLRGVLLFATGAGTAAQVLGVWNGEGTVEEKVLALRNQGAAFFQLLRVLLRIMEKSPGENIWPTRSQPAPPSSAPPSTGLEPTFRDKLSRIHYGSDFFSRKIVSAEHLQEHLEYANLRKPREFKVDVLQPYHILPNRLESDCYLANHLLHFLDFLNRFAGWDVATLLKTCEPYGNGTANAFLASPTTKFLWRSMDLSFEPTTPLEGRNLNDPYSGIVHTHSEDAQEYKEDDPRHVTFKSFASQYPDFGNPDYALPDPRLFLLHHHLCLVWHSRGNEWGWERESEADDSESASESGSAEAEEDPTYKQDVDTFGRGLVELAEEFKPGSSPPASLPEEFFPVSSLQREGWERWAEQVVASPPVSCKGLNDADPRLQAP